MIMLLPNLPHIHYTVLKTSFLGISTKVYRSIFVFTVEPNYATVLFLQTSQIMITYVSV